ncbi:MAG: hypothetical protein GX567_00285 [Clostridia bacterium]|nr:hypothetical protein [Clostridia bacterium]
MKDVLTKSFLIVLAIGLFYLIFLRECKQTDCPPKDYQLVSNEFMDSLIAVANKPPVIIVKDSIVYRDTIIYIIKKVPDPIIVTPETNVYRDSIYNDSIRVWTELHVDGTVQWWDQWYQPIIHYRTITEKVNVPYPVIEKVPYCGNALYLSGLAGAMGKDFAIGIGADFVTNNRLYGIQYNRIGDANVIQGKLGLKIKFKK